MASYLDDIYSRLDSQTQEGLVREGRIGSVTTNTRGTTTTYKPTAATTTQPTAQEVSTAQFIQDSQDAGTDLTQAANRLTTSGAGGSGGPTLTMEEAIRLQDEAAAKRAAVIESSGQRIDPVTGGVLGGSRSTSTPTGTSTGTSTPTAPVGPAAPEGPGAPVAEGNFGQFTEAEIDAALRGIEAEFGMTREQLMQDKSMIGAQYRLLIAQLARARQQAVQSATSDAVGRGIYRSGILGENIANIEQDFGEQESAQRQQQMIQEQALERQLAFLDQGQAAAQAGAENRILGQAAATMTQAGVNPTQAGFGQGAVQLPQQVGPTPAPTMGAPTGVIPRTALGPGDISGQAPPVAQNPYAGFPIVGGWYIDPNTGMAVARAGA